MCVSREIDQSRRSRVKEMTLEKGKACGPGATTIVADENGVRRGTKSWCSICRQVLNETVASHSSSSCTCTSSLTRQEIIVVLAGVALVS